MDETVSVPLRVLLIEDSESDAWLVVHALRDGGFAPEHQRVETCEAMVTALESARWDVVISDYAMPQFNGLDALAVLRESGLDLPFIIVTGASGEEEAVRCLHSGAVDYLLKDRLGRLPSAVRRALDTFEERRRLLRAEQKLAASERRLRAIFETEPECVKVLGPDCTILEMNPAGLRMLEADSFAQIAGLPLLGLVLPEYRAAFSDLAERVMQGGSGMLEFEIRGLKGGRRRLETHAVPMRDEQGLTVSLLGITRDITARSRAEESLDRERTLLRTLIDLLPDQIYIKDTESRFLLANAGVTRSTGVAKPGDLIGKTDSDFYPPEEAAAFLRDEQDVLAGDAVFNKEETVTRPDGSRRFILTTKVPLKDSAGSIIGLVGIGHDITGRRQAEEAVRVGQARLDTVIQNLTEGMVISTLDGQLLHWNPAALEQHGFANEAEARKQVEDFKNIFTLATLDGVVIPFEQWPLPRIIRGEKLRGCELRIRRLGTDWERIFSYSGEIVHPASGPALAFLTFADITERKRAERAVQTSQQMLQLVLDNIPQGVFWKDRESRYLGCNAVIVRHRGVAKADALKGKSDRDFPGLPPEQAEAFIRKDREVMESGQAQLGIIEQTTSADGTVHWLETNKVPLRDANGNVIGVLGTWQNITARKQAEEAVQTSQRMLQTVLNNIPQGVFWKDRKSRYLGCNALVMRTFGIEDTQAIVGMTDFDFTTLTREQAEFFVQKDREVMESGQPQLSIIERATMPDGSTRWLETNKVPLFGVDGRVIGILGTWQDITERKQTEEALEMMRFSVDHAGDSAAWVNREGRILYVNDAYCVSRGYRREELLAMRIFDLDPDYQPGVWAPHFEELKRRGTMTFETRHCAKDGRIFPVEVNANYVFLNGQEFNFATVRDLTERRKQERLALRSQRMESLGTLAGGIAHDLNNALAPIMMSSELLRIEYPRESSLLDRIEASAEHAADMVRQLLTFAKGAEGARVSVQPGRLLREMENLMKGSFPKNIELLTKSDPQLPTVLGDATQLHQVLLNLCVNARDAMPAGGTLTLEAERQEVDAAFAESEPGATPGSYVALRVRDTGAGIPPDILDRIFDPFFTTKGPEKGTGLGLSTVMGIVKGHGGFTQVTSQTGSGTTFIVFIPVDPAGIAADPGQKAVGQFRGRGETILFVDDEATVRNVARAVLQHLNFHPLIAGDGTDGLMQATQHRTEIRAIITDLHMPRMDGLAFVREVRLLLPSVPILVASGRMDDEEASEMAALGVAGRLDKPFNQAQLAEALEGILTQK